MLQILMTWIRGAVGPSCPAPLGAGLCASVVLAVALPGTGACGVPGGLFGCVLGAPTAIGGGLGHLTPLSLGNDCVHW